MFTRYLLRVLVAGSALLALPVGASAEDKPAAPARPAPTLWISPPGVENGKALRALFEHPEEWPETRSLVDVLFYTDLNFQRQFKDEELRAWFGQMQAWKIKLAMEVGAVKEWGRTGEKTFAVERAN